MDRVIKNPGRLQKFRIVISFLEKTFALLVALALSLALLGILQREHEGQDAVNLLVDCTTPGHSCYEKAEARTGKVIHQLELIVVYANLCTTGHRHPTEPVVLRCITQNVNKLQTPQLTPDPTSTPSSP